MTGIAPAVTAALAAYPDLTPLGDIQVTAATDRAGRLVTGSTSHQIYVIENGERRWVPDLWTMHDHGLSPAQLEVISDDVLAAIPEGAELASTVPVSTIVNGTVVESENGAWEMRDGKLEPVREPGSFAVSRGLVRDSETSIARATAVYLPMSLLRAALASPKVQEVTS